jgi:uncharacterized protein with PQ loop repeat
VILLLGAAASLFSLSATVPQVLRAARTRSVEGLSYASVVLSLATFTLWVVYAFAVADRVQIVNNVLAFVLLIALAVVVARTGGRTSWGAVGVILVSVAGAVVVVDVLNSFVLAMAATAVSSVRMLPQTRLALARRPMSGLDPWSLVLGWTGMVLWASYGAVVGDLGVLICSGLGLVMQSAIVAVRVPPRRSLQALAEGRLGVPVARLAAPLARRFPVRAAAGYGLAA